MTLPSLAHSLSSQTHYSHSDGKCYLDTAYHLVIKHLLSDDHYGVTGKPIQHTRVMEVEAVTFTFLMVHITTSIHDGPHFSFKINFVNRL